MKHLLLIVALVLLLILLNACVGDPPGTPDTQQTEFIKWETEVASKWTPTPTLAPNPFAPPMVSQLNADLLTANALESTVDAELNVNNIDFRNDIGSQTFIFRIEVGCTCMNSSKCCTPERTFVAIVETMKRFNNSLPPVPPGLTELMVVCFDQQTKSQIGAISAPWQYVHGYLWGNIDGHQLGVQITRTIAPTP